ncbi:MAG: pentapeptide repeat-containing protein [Phormidesmis sp.]
MARMTAQEVLRRYADGVRDFRNANLRGLTFEGKDLSEIDFSGADIRSTNFRDTTLRNVNFTGATAGLQKRWLMVQWILVVVSAVIAGVFQGFAGAYAAIFWDSTRFSTFESIIGLGSFSLFVIATYGAISLQGFSSRTLGIILISFAFLFAFAGAFAGVGSFEFAGSFAFAFSFAGVVAIAIAGLFTCSGAIAVAGAVTGTVLFLLSFVGAGAYVGLNANVGIELFISLFIGLLFSLFVGYRVFTADEKFDVVRTFGLVLAAVGGTSFCGANLTGATFHKALLRSSSFAKSRQHKTVLTRVCWQGAMKLDHARLGTSILQDRRVLLLLTTPEKGYQQDFTDANLRGAYLKGVTLERAILRRAILIDSLLEKAVLKDAILTEAQAVNADLTDAYLTGATLEAWNIDSTTTLKNIDCQYVFLREHEDNLGNRERRPHNPDKVFQPGDFEKFFQEILDDVQILIRDGIELAAFRAAFQNIMDQNPGVSKDSIKSLERQGSDVLLTLEVSELVDKGKLEKDWDAGYQAGLDAGRDAERLESAPKFEKLAFALAKRNISVESKSEVRMGDDYSRSITVQGDVNQSAIVVGDNNQVSLQISQLDKTDGQRQLKDLLTQLQAAIEADGGMRAEDKTEALAEVGEIAVAGQALQDGQMKRAAKRAISVLKGMTVGLGETARFVEACNGLLPAIAVLFGL